jgi:GNAT superfamily N-acetyltransferase
MGALRRGRYQLGRPYEVTVHTPDRDPFTVRQLTGVTDAQLHELAVVLVDCVEGGASVSFMHPLPLPKAMDFWRRVAADVDSGTRALLVAEDSSGIVGTAQLVLAQPENQPHRADLSKMLVHRRARRRGIGAALMRAAEKAARRHGKSLLVLDTASGDAERLYVRQGWQLAGTVPGYALWPQGGLCSTSFYYRSLRP